MDIHKPKPWHGLREFLKEYVIIVVGVLTALVAEQAVETLHWRHKLERSEQAMRLELGRNISTAAQYAILESCDRAYIDRLEADLVKGDPADIQKLYDQGSPLFVGSITTTAWDAALTSQVGDRMAGDLFLSYAESFRRSSMLQAAQFRMRDLESDALAGRFQLKAGQQSTAQELMAVGRIRRELELAQSVAKYLQSDTAGLGIQPTAPSRIQGYRAKAAQCMHGPPRKS